MIDFTYLIQPPKKYTFEMPQLKTWTEKWCKGLVLNLFAGNTKLNVKEIRNDIDKNMPADYHLDAMDLINEYKNTAVRFDTVILDPPYNLRKAREKYEGRYIGLFTKIKNEIINILEPAGRIIIFGYDSVGMAYKRGFEKIAICLVCHGGDHNDTICVVEECVQGNLFK